MIHGYSAEQIRAAEAPLIAAGVPLMARAAAGLADQVRRLLVRQPEQPPAGGDADHTGAARILLLVGSGDNGGDALFAGAELAGEGFDVAIVTTGERVHEAGLAEALAAGAHREPADPTRVARLAADSAVVVDGILGTGSSANPALRGRGREVVAALLPVVTGGLPRPLVVAVDLPSGIHPDDGSVPDPTVLPADITVTFGGCKAGLLIPPGSELAGRIRLVDIGLDPALTTVEPLVSVPDSHA